MVSRRLILFKINQKKKKWDIVTESFSLHLTFLKTKPLNLVILSPENPNSTNLSIDLAHHHLPIAQPRSPLTTSHSIV